MKLLADVKKGRRKRNRMIAKGKRGTCVIIDIASVGEKKRSQERVRGYWPAKKWKRTRRKSPAGRCKHDISFPALFWRRLTSNPPFPRRTATIVSHHYRFTKILGRFWTTTSTFYFLIDRTCDCARNYNLKWLFFTTNYCYAFIFRSLQIISRLD